MKIKVSNLGKFLSFFNKVSSLDGGSAVYIEVSGTTLTGYLATPTSRAKCSIGVEVVTPEPEFKRCIDLSELGFLAGVEDEVEITFNERTVVFLAGGMKANKKIYLEFNQSLFETLSDPQMYELQQSTSFNLLLDAATLAFAKSEIVVTNDLLYIPNIQEGVLTLKQLDENAGLTISIPAPVATFLHTTAEASDTSILLTYEELNYKYWLNSILLDASTVNRTVIDNYSKAIHNVNGFVVNSAELKGILTRFQKFSSGDISPSSGAVIISCIGNILNLSLDSARGDIKETMEVIPIKDANISIRLPLRNLRKALDIDSTVVMEMTQVQSTRGMRDIFCVSSEDKKIFNYIAAFNN